VYVVHAKSQKRYARSARHHHACYLPAARYKARLREGGWVMKTGPWARKRIAGREALMLVDHSGAVRHRQVKCKVMWRSAVQALEASYRRRSEAIRRRAQFDVIDANGRRRAQTGLPEDHVGILLSDLAAEL
jgi:hypothetical protein